MPAERSLFNLFAQHIGMQIAIYPMETAGADALACPTYAPERKCALMGDTRGEGLTAHTIQQLQFYDHNS